MTTRVSITESALEQRVRRALVKHKRLLHCCSPRDSNFDQLGRWYVTDADKEQILMTDISLEQLGHELGVIKGFELVKQDPRLSNN